MLNSYFQKTGEINAEQIEMDVDEEEEELYQPNQDENMEQADNKNEEKAGSDMVCHCQCC